MNWVENYRPSSLSELVLPLRVRKQLTPILEKKVPPRNMLLYGQAGTGKTSIAKILSEGGGGIYWNCTDKDNRSIAGIQRLLGGASSVSMFDEDFGLKKIVLDEADAITNDAQQSLKVPMETFTKSVWILCTNHIEKISEPIRSRCTEIYFGYDPEKGDTREGFITQMSDLAQRIFVNEGVSVNYDDEEIVENLKMCVHESYPESAGKDGRMKSPDLRQFIGMLQDRGASGEYLAF